MPGRSTAMPPAQAERAIREWSLTRVDILATTQRKSNPVARVELYHRLRGRLFGVGSAPAGFDAALRAVEELLGVRGTVDGMSLDFRAGALSAPSVVQVRMAVRVGDQLWSGEASTPDLLMSSVGAFLNALTKAAEAQAQSEVCVSLEPVSA